ncbi:MAG: UTP--glucose-1-phosphate uridylyltransferase, partial [Acidimicrobiales bacterium]
FLPATKAQPKEMLPVVDKPAIQYVVEEAVAAGLTDLLVITGRGKRALEDHFDRSPELEVELRAGGKDEALAEVEALSDLADMHYVRQRAAKGLGHAVGVARHHVGGEPFAVLLGDDIMVDESAVLIGMLDAHRRTGATIVALRRVAEDEISSYGCAAPGPDDGSGLVRLAGLVEKPAPADAPSDLAVMGRYVFGPDIFDAIDRTLPGKGGEIQLTDAMGLLIEEGPVYGYVFTDGRYDIGNKLDYLRATVELAARREDLGPQFRAFLRAYVASELFDA